MQDSEDTCETYAMQIVTIKLMTSKRKVRIFR